MTDRHLLTIGYVPLKCASERILCGDSSQSGTLETNIIIDEDVVSCMENDAVVKMDGATWFDTNHPKWKELIAVHCGDLCKERSLDPKKLARCWAIFQDEASPGKGIKLVAVDGEGGEFSNEDQQANGRFYVRYTHEEDGEYFNEQVVLIE